MNTVNEVSASNERMKNTHTHTTREKKTIECIVSRSDIVNIGEERKVNFCL